MVSECDLVDALEEIKQMCKWWVFLALSQMTVLVFGLMLVIVLPINVFGIVILVINTSSAFIFGILEFCVNYKKHCTIKQIWKNNPEENRELMPIYKTNIAIFAFDLLSFMGFGIVSLILKFFVYLKYKNICASAFSW